MRRTNTSQRTAHIEVLDDSENCTLQSRLPSEEPSSGNSTTAASNDFIGVKTSCNIVIRTLNKFTQQFRQVKNQIISTFESNSGLHQYINCQTQPSFRTKQKFPTFHGKNSLSTLRHLCNHKTICLSGEIVRYWKTFTDSLYYTRNQSPTNYPCKVIV